ncbi:helix-turn-helix transcriptional regulator [Streptomyces sp. NPDC101225]|uniref:helix-turn-helix transcriptional regulator n=1 Tax=Streptomyces sp. NPDC101225 TaxID=3366135 RepID=UPI00380DF9A2
MRTRAAAFVGRPAELAALRTVLVDARRGHGTVAFLTGEPGIGKSRLLREFLGCAVDAEMPVLRGRSSVTGPPVPFRPLTEALMSVARTLDPDLARQLGPYQRVLGRLVPDWADPDGQYGDASMVVIAEAVLRLTALVGRENGCVLALDDLHEADPETLAVVEYLAGNLAGQPVAVVASVRTESPGAHLLAEEVSRRNDGITLPLTRLGRPEVHELVTSCLEAEPGLVPAEVSDRLLHDSAGNPLMVEELLHSMIATGELVYAQNAWRLTGVTAGSVPPTLVRLISARADRLGPGGSRLLSVAALLGRRFQLTLAQHVLGLDDQTLLNDVQSAVEAQLLTPDEGIPGWYTFQHPLAVEALRSRLSPGELARTALRAAETAAELYPELPDEWCQLAARLREHAGEFTAAARLYLECGRRATVAGAPGSAVAVLEHARSVLDDPTGGVRHHGLLTEILEALLQALADDGRLEKALAVAEELTAQAPGDRTRQIGRHIRLAWAAQVAGHWAQGDAQVSAARELLPGAATEEQRASLDAVAAYLAVLSPAADRMARSAELARSAAQRAERIPLPAAVCQAWYILGFAGREHDLTESDACFRRALDCAVEHGLTAWRNYALVGLGGNAWLAQADAGPLTRAHQEVLRAGAIALAQNASAVLGLHRVLTADFERAEEELQTCLTQSRGLRLVTVTHYALMARVVLAAHRGRREEMQAAIAEFARHGGDDSGEASLVHGLGRAFCALLEEDRATAELDMARVTAEQGRRQSPFHLDGHHGLGILLDVLAGRADEERLREAAATGAGGMRWNRQFVALAEAVLAGRRADAAGVSEAMRRAEVAAGPFRMARCLGLRLVAEPAAAEGWGRPRDWLREAEEYFHQADVGPVAGACRTMLRRLGEPVRQRRTGTNRIPDALRRLGVTVREFEVLEMMPDKPSNKALAARLHISPRTVEKHVASLMLKTGLPDRGALVDRARELLSRT